jgi:hypothetical protein
VKEVKIVEEPQKEEKKKKRRKKGEVRSSSFPS